MGTMVLIGWALPQVAAAPLRLGADVRILSSPTQKSLKNPAWEAGQNVACG
jgi:hypothetical protein